MGQLGWQHSFNEQLVTYVSAGMNYSQSELQLTSQPLLTPVILFGLPLYENSVTGQVFTSQQFSTASTTNTHGIGGVFQASVQKSFEKGSIALVAAQNQTPTSQGLQTQSQLTLTPTYALTERWSSSLAAQYSMYKMPTSQNSLNNLDRTTASVSPNISWKWTPEVNVGVSYTYREQEYKNSNQLRQDNGIQLQFTYQPQTNNQVK